MKTNDRSKVSGADSSAKPMKSMGRIHAEGKLDNGIKIQLPDAMLLGHRLNQQLMSIGVQTDHGYCFMFLQDYCYVFKDEILIKKVKKVNNIYSMLLLPKEGGQDKFIVAALQAFSAQMDVACERCNLANHWQPDLGGLNDPSAPSVPQADPSATSLP